jgi:outer membrane protein
MKIIRKTRLLLFLLALPYFAYSQNTKTLSLEEGIRLGLENSKQLKMTGTKLDIAKAKRLQYWNAQVPTISYTGNYSHLSDNITPFTVRFPTGETTLNPQILNQFTNRLSISQIVFAGYRAIRFYESSEFLEKAAALDIDKDKIEIKNNIVSAIYNLYKLQTSGDILEKNLTVLRGRLKDVKNFVTQGTALENDQLKAELAISQVEMSQKEVQNAIEVANFNLSLMLGLAADTKIELDKNTLFQEKSIDNVEVYLKNISSRPDIVATDLRRQVANKSVDIAKGGLYPTISVGANAYLNNPNQRVFPQEANFKGTWDVGVTVAYNFTNLYTGKFQIQEAQANVAQANLLKEQITDAAKMEINTAYFAYQTASEKTKLIEKTIAQATENQRVIKNRYGAQIATLTELLDADFLLLQTKINLETVRADAELAYYKLLKAVGK